MNIRKLIEKLEEVEKIDQYTTIQVNGLPVSAIEITSTIHATLGVTSTNVNLRNYQKNSQ